MLNFQKDEISSITWYGLYSTKPANTKYYGVQQFLLQVLIMTQEQIDLVLRRIAEIAGGDESKAITLQQIRQKTGVDRNELEYILIYLGKEGYIKDEYRVFEDITPIYITHLGIQKSLSLNQG